jgi:hypothetical protein
MSSIYFPGTQAGGGGGGAGVEGLPVASSVMYVTIDGGTPMSGALVPATDNLYGVGKINSQWNSGCFDAYVVIGTIALAPIGVFGSASLQIKQYPDTTKFGDLRLFEFRGNAFNSKLTQAQYHMGTGGFMAWTGGALPNTNMDVNITRKFAGMVRVGTTTNNSAGGVLAQSGIFPSGVVLIAPNGSGWLVSVDTNNNLVTSGPLVV